MTEEQLAAMTRDDLIAEVRRLREVVGKLPRDAKGKPIAPDMTCYYLSSHGVQKTFVWKVLGRSVDTLAGHMLPAIDGVVSELYTDLADAKEAMREVEAKAAERAAGEAK